MARKTATWLLGALLLGVIVCNLAAYEIIPGIKVNPDGTMKAKTFTMYLAHYGQNWMYTGQNKNVISSNKGFPKASKDSWELQGKFTVDNHTQEFILSEVLEKRDQTSFSYSVNLDSETPVPSKTICLTISLPLEKFSGKKIMIDGKEVILPVDLDKTLITTDQNVEQLSFQTSSAQYCFQGKFALALQDNRKFKANSYSLRLMATPGSGDITKSKLQLGIECKPYESQVIDLRSVVNMGFQDELNGDKQGGWTDQGPENDLRMIKPGRQRMAGVFFDIINPKSNNGRSCLAFAGPDRDYFSSGESITIPDRNAKYLYLLHALAWAPKSKTKIGNIQVTYADGTTAPYPITAGIEVGDWWAPFPRENGALGWTGENRSSYVGLFVSKFKLSGKPIKGISLTPEKNSVWMVAGLSTSMDNIPCQEATPPTYIIANKQWKPFTQSQQIVANSALDFSFMQDAPAGKHGRVVIRNGHFEFADKPGEKVRFYGNNLCFSAQYLEKAECEALADQFARIGYNSVRFHHFDNNLSDQKSSTSTDLDKQRLDQLDYLFHCFKKRGIYVTIDIYISRRLRKNEIPEYPNATHYEMKALAPILESARANWKTYAKNLLTHKNPYTGMTWANDPALFSISLLNENTIYNVWDSYPAIKQMYLERFEEWLKQRNTPNPGVEERNKLLLQFLTSKHIATYEELKQYIRDLGCKAELSDANFVGKTYQAIIRNHFDYVDNHAYWDHPKHLERNWHLPYGFGNRSAISANAAVPRGLMPSRIFGKPYMITEFNYCFPNNYRGEGGPLMGAYAALQGWDGLYRFAYAHRDSVVTTKDMMIKGFDLAHDPIAMLSEKIGLLLFLRRDVAEATSSVPFVFSDSYIMDIPKGRAQQGNYPQGYANLGLCAKIGCINANELSKDKPADTKMLVSDQQTITADPARKVVEWSKELYEQEFQGKTFNLSKNLAVADTGQITLVPPEKQLKVVTSKSEILIVDGNVSVTGKLLSVENQQGFTVFALVSRDGQPLATSRRMLLFYLTDVQNSTIKFRDPRRSILADWGKLPLLLRQNSATIKLSCGDDVEIHSLKLNGEQNRAVSVRKVGNVTEFTVTTNTDSGGLVYEIVRK